MLENYLSSSCFIGVVIFIVGLWVGGLRGYRIYRYKLSLFIFISLSTIITPVLPYMWAGSQPRDAEMQAIYVAIAGFLIPTLYAEYLIFFRKRNKFQEASKAQPVNEKNQSQEPVPQFNSMRFFIYFSIFLMLFLFPPYYEAWTQSRTWVFITSRNLKPLYTFDFAFFIYELILMLTVFAGIEFWRTRR